MPDKLSEEQLGSIIAQQIELARSHDKAERATSREKALDYFFGNMDEYVPPEANRSRVVSRDVADTISRMLPGIMRVFMASDRMAIAEPTGVEDVEFAKQATDGLNFVFWKDNDGDEIIYSVTWDALLTSNAIVKTYYDDTPVYTTSFHSGLTEDQVALLVADDGTEVLASSMREEMVPDPMTGQPMPVQFYNLKIKHKKAEGTFVVDAIPPEEFLIDANATKTEEAAFTDHWQRKTRSDLVAMGYDKDDVWAIPEATRDTPEDQARRQYGDRESTDASMQIVDYHECFIRVDVDGDGEAELVRACYGGASTGKLLDWEVWEDEHPFDDIKCEPVPHRWLARSVADETVDVQDVKTVLLRQLLNNIYWANNPQRFVKGKIHNPDQLDNPTFGGSILGDPNSSVENLEVPMVADAALQGMATMDEVLQRRTGVSKSTMALDPEALQNQTAEAVREGKDAGYAQVEQVARNMATGWRKVFRKLMRLMIKHQDYARKVMYNGKEVVIDPRYWNADMNVTINVGLGTGSRDRDLQMMGQVMQSQLMLADRFLGVGAMEDAIDMLPKIVATMTKMGESAGIRNPEEFYPEYTDEKVQALKQAASQPKGPPEAVLVEQERQKGAQALAQMNAQIALQTEQGKNQLAEQQARIQAEGDIVKNKAELEADLATKQADRQNALLLEQQRQEFERQKLNAEFAFKNAEMQNKMDLELLKLGQHAAANQQQSAAADGEKANAAKQPDMGAIMDNLSKALSAPKRIVRDAQGRAIGVESAMGGPQ